MKWIGQHIYDYVAAFRRGVTMDSTLAVTGNTTLSGNLTFDSVALTGIQTSSESFVDDDVSVMTSAAIADKIEAYGYSTTTGDITGVDLTATTGIDITSESGTTSGNYTATIGVDVSDFMTNGADNRIVTAVGTNGLNAEANFTFDGTDLSCTTDTVTFTSANADDPAFLIVNTANDNQACRFRMMKDRGSAQTNNDRVGEMDFVGEDAAGNQQQYGKIMIQALEVTHGQEAGKMSFQVAEYDGANTTGLSLSGQDADGEVDVTIGAGAASTTTITGTLTTGSTAALTNAGLVAVANQSNITGLGTISSGVWEGTAVATDQQKHVMHYQTTGYSVPDGTNYDIAKAMSTNTHPFLHDQSIGSDGLTAQTVQTWARNGGHVMPRACTLKRWTGWSTAVGSGTAYVALFKVTPARNDNSNVSAVLLEEFSYTAMGNAKMEDFDETSFTNSSLAAGDIVVTALKGVASATMYFNATYEVEF